MPDLVYNDVFLSVLTLACFEEVLYGAPRVEKLDGDRAMEGLRVEHLNWAAESNLA